MKGFTTKAIHGPRRTKRDAHGSLRTPVYDTVAFEFEHARDLQLSFEGRKPAHAYSRITNPTVEEFEQRVSLLAGARGVIALASGMAGISNVILALGGAGTNIVTTRALFGNTLSLFEETLRPWGLEPRYVDMNVPEAVEAEIDSATRAIYLETITNPQLQVADIAAITQMARRHGVPVIVDGTMTTPYLFESKAAGVAVEVVSSTKFLSGGATSIGGLIIDNGVFDWSRNPELRETARRTGPFALLSRLRREVYRNLGSCMAPHTAYLQTLGLETLALRVERTCANALALAEFLDSHPKVRSVNYPGLSDSPYRTVASRQFSDRFGGILTFDLDTREAAFKLMDSLRVIRRATNLNDNKTLVIHPASTIFAEYDAQKLRDMNIGDTTIRLSAGIEDIEDLIADLAAGLEEL